MVQVDHAIKGAEHYVSALETFVTERSVVFASGHASIARYTWESPTLDVWSTDGYFLHMNLSPLQGHARATYVDGTRGVSETVGRVMFVPPGRMIRSGGAQGSQRSLSCLLSAEAIEGIVGGTPEWQKTMLAEALHLNSPEVDWFLHKLYDEMVEPGFAQQAMTEALAGGLAVALVRTFNLKDESARRSGGGLAPWRMRLIRDRVYSDDAAPRLHELAGLCGMSVRHLTRAFKTETGGTIAKYVENAAVERARAMLERGELPIEQIARRLGFSSSSSFTHAFRRATGARPSELRRRADFAVQVEEILAQRHEGTKMS